MIGFIFPKRKDYKYLFKPGGVIGKYINWHSIFYIFGKNEKF